MRPAARLGWTSVLAFAGAVVAYVSGIWGGHFLDLRATSDYCSAKPLAFPATAWSWFPLGHQCRWSDGTSSDLVGSYVNPIVFGCLIAAVVSAVLAARIARRDRVGT